MFIQKRVKYVLKKFLQQAKVVGLHTPFPRSKPSTIFSHLQTYLKIINSNSFLPSQFPHLLQFCMSMQNFNPLAFYL